MIVGCELKRESTWCTYGEPGGSEGLLFDSCFQRWDESKMSSGNFRYVWPQESRHGAHTEPDGSQGLRMLVWPTHDSSLTLVLVT